MVVTFLLGVLTPVRAGKKEKGNRPETPFGYLELLLSVSFGNIDLHDYGTDGRPGRVVGVDSRRHQVPGRVQGAKPGQIR